jgi:hypothetical protein
MKYQFPSRPAPGTRICIFSAALLLSTLNYQPSTLFAQGSLTPPGAPAPTMKTLDQVEARIIVNVANTPGNATNTFIISQPGSYYLTGNITGVSGKHGISIQADDVTLDLNGFALISGGGGAFRGVNVPAAQKNLYVRNGTVRGWTDGGVRTDLATSTLAEKLRLSDNVGATGLALGNGSARDCVATGNATGFVLGNGAQIEGCTATSNGDGFILNDRAHANNCIATTNTGIGFNCTNFVTLLDCTASRNFGAAGIAVQGSCSIIRCNASRNIPSGNGINAGDGCTITNCTAGSNALHGILAGNGCNVAECTLGSNGHAGIYAVSGCRVYGNTCASNNTTNDNQVGGITVVGDTSLIDSNLCSNNGLYGFVATRHNLVVRNVARGQSTNYSVTGGTAIFMTDNSGGNPVPTAPWTNFELIGN